MAVQGGTFSILANKVMFANKLTLLFKATADNESPTPGYMLQEIINISNESGSHCSDLLEVLVERLQENSCNVKLKVLRIMKHVVEKGHPDFSTGLRKKSRGIQAATKHNGPPDPLHGNMPYILVRKEAHVVLSVLFEVKDDSQLMSPQGQSKTMGSISSVGIGSVDSSGTLRGFGNTPMKEKSLTESFMSGLKEVAEKVFDPHPLGRDVRPRELQTFSQYKPVTLATTPIEASMERSTTPAWEDKTSHRPARKITPRQKGQAGGGWEDDAVVLETSTHLTTIPAAAEEQIVGTADTDSEERLAASWLEVDKDTPLLPTRKQVEEFVKQCSTLNCDKMATLLSTSLADDKDPVLMRSLLALERFLHCDQVGADQLACTCAPHLLHLSHRPTGAVKSKAKKVLWLLRRLCSNQAIIERLMEENRDSEPENTQQDTELSSNPTEKGLFQELSLPPIDVLKAPFASHES